MQPLWDERYQPADAEIVKKKAKRMAGQRGIRTGEVEDIEQELAMHVSQQTHRHRPERGSRAGFVGKIAKNKMLNLIKTRSAKKRDDRRNIEYDDSPEGTLIDGDMTQEQIDLELDLKDIMERMPPDLRQIVELRRAGHSDAEMEDALNLTRGKVRALIERTETFLREAGLDPHDED